MIPLNRRLMEWPMATGPGKYDHLATLVRQQATAAAVIVIVIDGVAGSGFSVQGNPEITARLPRLLRTIADGVESDLAGVADGR